VKILWIKANKLLPVSSGGDIRSYHIARRLGGQYELVFLSYYEGEPDRVYEEELQKHFPGAVAICTGKKAVRSLAGAIDYVASTFDHTPYAVGRFASAEVRRFLEAAYKQRSFDVAVCDFLDAAVNIPSDVAVPTVLFQHNVESEIWRRHSETESNPVKRAVYKTEFKKMRSYEEAAVRNFHHVIAVSDHDADLMSTWTDRRRITVVPTGVDLQSFHPKKGGHDPEPIVMFVGAMDWEPNVDAMEYFCRDIWPSVQARVPQARLRIVGRNPNARVQKLKSDSVEVTGSVPSVLEHLHQAAVVVVPLRIGGGTRIKIYEAMAAGKAVVSTTVGAEGLDVCHGKDLILADTGTEFGDAVCALLTDGEKRRALERAAADSAAGHDWSAIGIRFGEVLARVACGDRSRVSSLPVVAV